MSGTIHFRVITTTDPFEAEQELRTVVDMARTRAGMLDIKFPKNVSIGGCWGSVDVYVSYNTNQQKQLLLNVIELKKFPLLKSDGKGNWDIL